MLSYMKMGTIGGQNGSLRPPCAMGNDKERLEVSARLNSTAWNSSSSYLHLKLKSILLCAVIMHAAEF